MLFLLLQAAQPLPDLELNASITANLVKIERAENVTLQVGATPDAGSAVTVRKQPENSRSNTLRNVKVTLKAQARIADPAQANGTVEPQLETTNQD